MVGIQASKSEVDNVAGGIGRDLQVVVNRIVAFKAWLDAKTDADLTALGYDGTDIANLRSAFADASQLATIFRGEASLAQVKDFRTFLRRLWGMAGL